MASIADLVAALVVSAPLDALLHLLAALAATPAVTHQPLDRPARVAQASVYKDVYVVAGATSAALDGAVAVEQAAMHGFWALVDVRGCP